MPTRKQRRNRNRKATRKNRSRRGGAGLNFNSCMKAMKNWRNSGARMNTKPNCSH